LFLVLDAPACACSLQYPIGLGAFVTSLFMLIKVNVFYVCV
jgi:hypothetical protein